MRAAASTIPIRNTASRALVAALAIVFAYAGPAQANGDPASHVLPGEDVYLPRQSEPSGPVTTALALLLKRTESAGYPLRVALIATPADLGSIPQYFERPHEYAEYLAPEVSYQGPCSVMPSGYGADNAGRRGQRALGDVAPPSGSDGDALGRAAIRAGAALSRAAGHPVKIPQVSGGSSGILVPLLAVVGMAALAGVLAVWKRRTAGADSAGTSAGP